MEYEIKIVGISPIIMHSASGANPRHPLRLEASEITRRQGSNRTESDDAHLAEIETTLSFWLDANEMPTIPASAVRANIETAARKRRQGPQVREGLLVSEIVAFEYDSEKYGETLTELRQTTQFTVPVKVQRNMIFRTRARFELPWALTFRVDVDDELVDEEQLRTWLDIGGRRIGLGDWRPEKSGIHGRYKLESIKELSEDA